MCSTSAFLCICLCVCISGYVCADMFVFLFVCLCLFVQFCVVCVEICASFVFVFERLRKILCMWVFVSVYVARYVWV